MGHKRKMNFLFGGGGNSSNKDFGGACILLARICGTAVSLSNAILYIDHDIILLYSGIALWTDKSVTTA